MGDYCNFLDELTEELIAAPPPSSQNLTSPDISVIIPAYNTADYIVECLRSVVNQTLKNIEILVVDDGSTDKTNSVVKMFMQYDWRIKLITQRNQGPGIAKNNAIKIARGKCIAFIDSDDILEYDALEKTYKIYEQTKSDIVIFGAYGLCKGKKTKCHYSIKRVPKRLLGKTLTPFSAKDTMFKLPVIAMCKLYDRKFLIENNILFQEVKKGEDQLFFVKSILMANKLYIINQNLYGYRKDRKDSLTYSKLKKDNSVILNFYAIEKFLQTYNINYDIKLKILNKYFNKCVSWLGKCEKSYRNDYFNELRKLIVYLQENHPELSSVNIKLSPYSKYLIIKFKLLYLLLRRKLNGNK